MESADPNRLKAVAAAVVAGTLIIVGAFFLNLPVPVAFPVAILIALGTWVAIRRLGARN